jgi:hypothetical protein
VALAALRARVEVDEVLPGEIADEGVADFLRLRVSGYGGELLAGGVVAEGDPGGPGEHVNRLRERDRGHEPERDDAVHPPLDVAGVVCRRPIQAEVHQTLPGQPADRRPHLEVRVVSGDAERLEEEAGEREEEEETEERPVSDHVRTPVVLAFCTVGPPVVETKRPQDPALDGHDREPDDERCAEEVEEERVAEVEPAVPEVEVEERPGDVVLEREDGRSDEEDEEPVEDEQVPQPGRRVAAADQ